VGAAGEKLRIGHVLSREQGVDGVRFRQLSLVGRTGDDGADRCSAAAEHGCRVFSSVDEPAMTVLQARRRQAVDQELDRLCQGERLLGSQCHHVGRRVVIGRFELDDLGVFGGEGIFLARARRNLGFNFATVRRIMGEGVCVKLFFGGDGLAAWVSNEDPCLESITRCIQQDDDSWRKIARKNEVTE
jgi:hypothetical protein